LRLGLLAAIPKQEGRKGSVRFLEQLGSHIPIFVIFGPEVRKKSVLLVYGPLGNLDYAFAPLGEQLVPYYGLSQ